MGLRKAIRSSGRSGLAHNEWEHVDANFAELHTVTGPNNPKPYSSYPNSP